MEELEALLKELINENLRRLILSNPIHPEAGSKAAVRPLLLKGQLCFQTVLYRGNKVFHYNGTAEETAARALALMKENFRQAEAEGGTCRAVVLISKKGRVTVKRKRIQAEEEKGQPGSPALLEHNRSKRYILEEGRPVDFLVGLGVQTPDGRVVRSKYDKFRQINRYLEFIEDVMKNCPVKNRSLSLISAAESPI